jgi:hypothetical protein
MKVEHFIENENVFDIINEINMNSTMYERMNEGSKMLSNL